ncbi:hypothetical protein SAMN04487909_14637 [Aneurinibacillus migulanus]|uniref:Uncharacterized protein n=1 Tax=Aneurinibacillus migulanus TaxID=47500 RepID=A0A1G9AHL7_ANEMI|nr:hypothetical protein AMI01nite_45410 [Aneurinibacillus migulanus]SDK26837.1 hypothetical protein SAMN04487909_14637 [Aneurinibacillus migulanus]
MITASPFPTLKAVVENPSTAGFPIVSVMVLFGAPGRLTVNVNGTGLAPKTAGVALPKPVTTI